MLRMHARLILREGGKMQLQLQLQLYLIHL